ncbi:MAG: hypothetical protein NXH79_13650 [Rhodobacteraceae bacterium]|nr:hypothetical protein [Paracoccaceae bacterium]
MGQSKYTKMMMLTIAAVFLALTSVAAWAVLALRIHPEHEREAAFCLGILESGGSQISFADGRAIQLLGERLSYIPETSPPSHEGRLAAVEFLSGYPSTEQLANRLMACRADLTSIIQRYLLRSCGYGVGALSDDWSIRDRTDFYELTEGPIPEGGIEFLNLRWRLLQ